jgi:transcriptional regulator GlxA family with amidase domain
MRRRGFLGGSLLLGAIGARGGWAASAAGPLKPRPRGKMKVAFAISRDATVIDFCGPWEVFHDVRVPDRGPDPEADQRPFELFTVADGPATVRVGGGMQVTPDYTLENAPHPDVIVVPAMRASEAMVDWVRKTSATVDLTMSVCVGAFVLGQAGLLDNGPATTHHLFFDRFAATFPSVRLERGRRFVERQRLATAGGLTSGIDLALRVVDRYFGRTVALATAEYMEYQSRAWVV